MSRFGTAKKMVRQTTSANEPKPDEELYESAVRALASRARSTAEIRLLLLKKKGGKQQIEAVIARLRENGYLDDARFARYFASSRLENDLHGKMRVRRDLKARGLNEDLAQQAIRSAFQGVNEGELLRRYLKRKVNLSHGLAKPAAVASLYRRLLHDGFSSDTIIRELNRIRQSPLAAKFQGHSAGKSAAGPMDWDELLDSLSEVSQEEAELD